MKKVKIIGSDLYMLDNELEQAVNKALESINRLGGTVERIEYMASNNGVLRTVAIEYNL